MADVAVEVEKLMANPGAGEAMDLVRERLEANEETSALLKVAHSIEEVYEIAKKCVTIEFAKFKEICEAMMAHFKSDKTVLDDEVLDNVAGGAWNWSRFWNNVAVGSIMAVCVAVGAAGGVAMTIESGPGMIAGFLVGGVMGYAAATVICEKLGLEFQS